MMWECRLAGPTTEKNVVAWEAFGEARHANGRIPVMIAKTPTNSHTEKMVSARFGDGRKSVASYQSNP